VAEPGRVEPFGTLVLAVAVTTIEVALIVALMLAGGQSANALARDTVFAAVMIAANGIVGLCLVVGGLRHGVLAYRVEGTSPALAALGALSGLALVLPNFTTTTAGPTYSGSQLAFAGVTSLALYGVFVFVQTVRHRDYFLPVGRDGDSKATPARRPNAVAWTTAWACWWCRWWGWWAWPRRWRRRSNRAWPRRACPMPWRAW